MERRTIHSLKAVLLGAALLAVAPGRATAEGQYALLVGVTSYKNSVRFEPLEGPANDVAIMKAALLERGFPEENIRTLTDDMPEGAPTRANIVAGLEWLAGRRAETAVVFLAGHGTQQPNDNPAEDPERDGQDEVFLPKDAGSLDAALRVRRGLVDDEVGAHLDAIQSSGAFVVFITDSCFSETQRRAGAEIYRPLASLRRYRKVDLTEGMGEADQARWASMVSKAARLARRRGSETAGGEGWADARGDEALRSMVALYAARADEMTPEEPLPRDGGSAVYGLFSFHIAKALTSYGRLTFRDLLRAVHQDYRRLNVSDPMPVGEGALDRTVFGEGTGARILQWPVYLDGSGPYIRAGRMHELAAGSVLTLYADPVSRDADDIMGYAAVESAQLARSTLRPVAQDEVAALNVIPDDVFARADAASFAIRLTVATPALTAQGSATGRLVAAALARLSEQDSTAFDLSLVAIDQLADLNLFADAGRVWLLPPSGELVREGPARTASVPIRAPAAAEPTDSEIDAFATSLGEELGKVARTLALAELTKLLDEGALTAQLTLDVLVRRGDVAPVTATEGDFAPGAGPLRLYDGDVMTLRIGNRGERPFDVTVLYVASDHGISCFFPGYNEINTLRPNDEPILFDIYLNDETVGAERIVVLATDIEPGERNDFCFLAQDGVPRTRGQRVALDKTLERAGLRGGERRPREVAGGTELMLSIVHRNEVYDDGR